MVFFLLSSLLPLIILLYITFQYVLPLLSPNQIDALRGWFNGGILAMLLFPLLGFVMMSQWMASLESLTREVKEKSVEVLEERFENTVHVNDENEISSLQSMFSVLYSELQEKMGQLDEYSKKLIETNQKLSELSIKDELTTLYNRRYFDVRLKEEINRADRYNHDLSIVMIDIDDFKKYNDTFGHQIGDVVLREIGILVRNNIRQSDIAFRYGGDEFSILLPETNGHMAAMIAERLVTILEKHAFVAAEALKPGQVTISCGVADYANHDQDFVMQADRLLLKAKSEGKARVLGAELS